MAQIQNLESKPPKKRREKKKKEKPHYEKFGLREFLFLAPAYISLILFVFLPMLFAIVLSFYKNPNETEFTFTYFVTEMWNNLSFTSLYDFFYVREELIPGLITKRGIFLVENIIPLVTTLIMFGYTRLIYRKFTEKKRIRSNVLRGFIALLIGLLTAPLTYFAFQYIVTQLNSLMVGAGWVSGLNYLPIDVYRSIIAAPDVPFMRILFNTFFWTLTCTAIHVVFGLILALLLNREFAGRSIFRSLMILPWAIPSFVSTLMWRYYIFDNNLGVLGAPGVSSYSVTTTNILIFILALGSVGLILVGLYKLLKIEKINTTLRPIVTFILIIMGVVGFIAFNGLLQANISSPPSGFFGYGIVDFRNITDNFWITDIVHIFDQQFAMITFSAILINSWLGIPFMMLSFLATLQSIPKDLYEAADIDGLTRWQKFKKITLPLLKPTLLTVSLLGIIWTFNLFNVVYLLSNNQNALPEGEFFDIFVTFIYNRFNDRNQYSQSAALSITVFIMLISFSLVYRRLLKAEKMWEDEKK